MPTFLERLKNASEKDNHKAEKWAAGGVAAGGVAVMNGAMAPLVAALGLTALTGGLALFAIGGALLAPVAYRVTRPRPRKFSAGKEQITGEEARYPYWDCHMSQISILGIRGTGKTTVRQILREQALSGITSTLAKEHYLISLRGNPEKFAVLMDTPGMVDAAGDQWDAARQADILILTFDHCDTRVEGNSRETTLDESRLKLHEKFVNDIFEQIKSDPVKRLRRVIILITKKDLWTVGASVQKVSDWSDKLRTHILNDYSPYVADNLSYRNFERESQNDVEWLLSELRSVSK